MALLSLDRHDVLESIRKSSNLYEAFLNVARLPAVGEYKTVTNADKIRTMSDEQLVDNVMCYVRCEACERVFHIDCDPLKTCRGIWLDWLKKEVEE